MKYCIWNNKGGVGKTFLTYTIATEYALKNPDVCVVVVDICPQANISEMLLGGNGKGSHNLYNLHNSQLTISHYIANRLKTPYETNLTGGEMKYFIEPQKYNNKISSNVRLVPGSSDLDLYSKGIEFFANASRQANQKDAWKNVKSWLKSLLEVQSKNLDSRYKTVVYFIDCNPSFASYTELALVASDRLIIPCTAEGASVRAIKNVFKIVYGIDAEDDYIASFSKDMKENNMRLPKIAMIILNRNKTKTSETKEVKQIKKQTSNAFSGVRDEVKKVTDRYVKNYPEYFIQNHKIYDVKDCNAISPILSYNGETLSNLIGDKKYEVYHKKATASQSQIKPIKVDIDEIIKLI